LARAKSIMAAEGEQVTTQALLGVLGVAADARDILGSLEQLVLRRKAARPTTVALPAAPVASVTPAAPAPVTWGVPLASIVPMASLKPTP
jgi:hypothetical protein